MSFPKRSAIKDELSFANELDIDMWQYKAQKKEALASFFNYA